MFFESRATGRKTPLVVNWTQPVVDDIPTILKKALNQRKSVEMEYKTSGAEKRLVDIHKIKGNSVKGFCHLRNAKRTFIINLISAAYITDNSYKLEEDVQQSFI